VIPTIDPIPPTLNRIVSNDVSFPRCMNAHKGEQPSLEFFGIIDWFESIPIIELECSFFWFD
jgi:hypothetical protein